MKLISALIFALLSSIAHAQTSNFTNYGLVDGLSQSEVPHLLEDSRGNIWMSTNGGGVTIFNGISFKPLTTFDGLTHNKVLCTFEAPSGIIYIGTQDGLNRYDGYVITDLTPKNLAAPFVVSNIIYSKGDTYVASNRGIYIIRDDKLSKLELSVKFDYLSFFFEGDNSKLWLGASDKLYLYNDGLITTFDSKSGLERTRLSAGCAMPNGEPLVACYGRSIYILKNNRFETFLPNTDIHMKFVTEMYVDQQRHLWLGTINNGVFKVNLIDSSITNYTTKDGLANNHVESILEDSWGNIWIGTGGGGVSKYHQVEFSHMNQKTGLAGDWIYSTLSDSQNRLWIGAGTEGVTIITDSTQEHFKANNGFVNAKLRLLYEDNMGRIWLGPEGHGLWVYDSSFHQVLSDLPKIEFDHIKAITQDSSSNYWVCEGGKGLIKFQYIDSIRTIESQTVINKKDGLPSDYVYTLHTDAINRVWFGTSSRGSGYILNDKVVSLTVKDGLASNAVSMITEDPNGYIWLAGGDGITRVSAFKSPLEFKKIGFNDGLTGIPVYQILYQDKNKKSGYLWAGTSNGVTRFELDNGELSSAKHFGFNEGFIGLETNANAVTISDSDKLYFGTGQGLMVFEGDHINYKPVPPKLSITQISLFYESIKASFPSLMTAWENMESDIELEHDQNNLSFSFFAVNHNNPEKVEYSWIMEGFDREWSPLSSQTVATYSNLPPGTYVFKVKAKNSDGLYSHEVSTKSFVISTPPPPPPPFWKSTWFIVTVSTIVLVILVLSFSIWYIRLKKERERIKMERNLIELEQKALRLQMNPHFIFNALNSIQSLITSNDNKKARYQLAKFSKLMRQILDNSREQMISLEEEVSTLENYMTIEQFSSGDAFDFKVSIQDDLELDLIAVPPMMIQPFTENAIIHGLKHIKHRGEIKVHFEKEHGYIKCSIEDNGIGRKEAAKIKSQIAQQHKSAALIVTQERLTILHGSKNNPGMEFIDKTDDNGIGNGTIVVIRFPFILLD